MITYKTDLIGVDWDALKEALVGDDFHNGRTTAQLRLSFENSAVTVLGYDGGRCIANGRALSDGVGNAYIVDVWTHSEYRGQGVATKVMEMIIAAVPGQHIYLQADDSIEFYKKMGFQEQPKGMSFVSGAYLQNDTRDLP